MIRYDGIIHLEEEDIAVESLKYTGHPHPQHEDLFVGTGMELTLENNEDYTKLLDLDKFSVEFEDMTILCTLNKNANQYASIKTLGFLQGYIENTEIIPKLVY